MVPIAGTWGNPNCIPPLFLALCLDQGADGTDSAVIAARKV